MQTFTRTPGPARGACVLALLADGLLAGLQARAEPGPLDPPAAVAAPEHRFLIGAALSSAPDYAGSDRTAIKPSPLWAWQYGRYRISTGRAAALLGFGADPPGPGASAELLSSGNLKFGAALRIDGGRGASDSPHLAGLPELRRTLRGRFYASYAAGPHWSLGASLSQDLLGRQGGALAAADLGYRAPAGVHSEWSAGVGLSFADRRYMQSYFGVTEAAARTSGLVAFNPGAGIRDLHAGIGWTTALTPRWIAFAGAGISALQGDAAASPLTHARSSTTASMAIAYRCCK